MRLAAKCAVLSALGLGTPLGAQSLPAAIGSGGGPVNVVFPSRPNLCGDGLTFVRSMRGGGSHGIYVGGGSYSTRDGWNDRPCTRGPVRVLATVLDGSVTRLTIFVGPVPASASTSRTATLSATDAAAWLTELASRAPGRVASQAIQALMWDDAPEPWPLLLRLAKDTDRPRDVRQTALTWLSFGVTDHLGLADLDEHATDEDEMRTQAVFVLTQRRTPGTVGELIDLSRTAKHPSVRKAAIFWLGQSGDRRAAEVFAELLGIR